MKRLSYLFHLSIVNHFLPFENNHIYLDSCPRTDLYIQIISIKVRDEAVFFKLIACFFASSDALILKSTLQIVWLKQILQFQFLRLYCLIDMQIMANNK